MARFAQRGFAGPVGWSLGAGAEHPVRREGGPQVPGGPAAASPPAAAAETQAWEGSALARPCPWGAQQLCPRRPAPDHEHRQHGAQAPLGGRQGAESELLSVLERRAEGSLGYPTADPRLGDRLTCLSKKRSHPPRRTAVRLASSRSWGPSPRYKPAAFSSGCSSRSHSSSRLRLRSWNTRAFAQHLLSGGTLHPSSPVQGWVCFKGQWVSGPPDGAERSPWC